MSDEVVQVKDGAVRVALASFAGTLKQRAQLLKEIAAGQLVSVRRTFREQGSPSGSWAPLAPSTVANKKSKATAGRKILILSGRLLNSIQATSTDTGVVIGTNLVYARVQQEGSGGGTSAIGAHTRNRLREIHYTTRDVTGEDGKQHSVPVAMRTGKHEVIDAKGKRRKVSARFQGPQLQTTHGVKEHERAGGIPARPYLVIRPEDPARIRAQVVAFTVRAAMQSGLQAGGTR